MAEEKGKGSSCPGHTPSPCAGLTDESWSPVEMGLGQKAKEQRNESPDKMLDTLGPRQPSTAQLGPGSLPCSAPQHSSREQPHGHSGGGTCPSRATSGGSSSQGFCEDREEGLQETP